MEFPRPQTHARPANMKDHRRGIFSARIVKSMATKAPQSATFYPGEDGRLRYVFLRTVSTAEKSANCNPGIDSRPIRRRCREHRANRYPKNGKLPHESATNIIGQQTHCDSTDEESCIIRGWEEGRIGRCEFGCELRTDKRDRDEEHLER